MDQMCVHLSDGCLHPVMLTDQGWPPHLFPPLCRDRNCSRKAKQKFCSLWQPESKEEKLGVSPHSLPQCE